MNISDEAKQELNIFLAESLKTLTEGIKDVKAELPKVAHEIVLYEGIIGNIVSGLQYLFSLIVMGAISFWINEHYSEYWGIHFLTITGGIAFTCGVSQCIFGGLRAKFAPRLFLLNYMADLIRPYSKD